MTFLGAVNTGRLWLVGPKRIIRLALLIAILVATNCSLIAQSTNIAIGTTVKLSSAKRLGVNLAGNNYYDSGQMLRNVIFANPGFEGQSWQSLLHCVSVTATTCTDGNVWNIWPVNFLKGATFEVLNGPIAGESASAGETGTIIASTISSYEAGNPNPTYGVTVTFASAPAVPLVTGQYLIVRSEMPGNAQEGWWAGVNGGATFSTDYTDLAPDSPGKQALQINASGTGQTAGVSSYFDSYGWRSFLQMKGTYTLAFKAKGLGGNNQINLSIARQSGGNGTHGNVTYLNQTVTLTNAWKDYTYTFTAAEDGTYLGTVQVSFAIAGADLYLDDVSLTAPAAANNPTAYRDEVVETLRALRPGVIRNMDFNNLAATTDDIISVPFARQRDASSNPNQYAVPTGLEEFLVLCQTVGAEPWYTLTGTVSTTDMQHLIEFLGGASTTPYGAKRAALGQTEPWTSVFPTIHLELGNEMWNGVLPDPAVYGDRAATVFKAARASSSYQAGKFDLIMGSWFAVPWWTQQEIANSSGYDSVDVAPYTFNTLTAYSTNELIFGPMFAQPEQMDSTATGLMTQQQQAAAVAPAKLAVYEVNLSTTSGTAPQNVVNQVVGGLGAGISVADHMLLMMRDLGVTTQNMFALTEYENPFSNTNGGSEIMPLWGSVIDMGGETNVQRPTFLAEELANSAILPTMLATTVTGANPTWNQPLSANDTVFPIQLANAHYLQSFAFTDGTNKSVVVFNLSRTGSLPITFSGANAPTGEVLVSQLTSTNLTDNNEGLTSDSPVVVPTHTNVANFNPATPYSLPPFSMTVFRWPGAALPSTSTALEASPTSSTSGQPVALSATVTSQSGAGTPTGKVAFMHGTSTIGSATLDGVGVASLSSSSLPVGSDSLTAVYSGSSTDAGSTSSALTVTVSPSTVATATTLTASATAVTVGQSVTFTAKVTPQSGSAAATGTVAFLDGKTSLGTATLNSSGIASFSTASLAVGSHSISADYEGSGTDEKSVSQAVNVTVAANYTFNFSGGFAQSAGLVKLNGSAALSGAKLQLANNGYDDAGSAFYTSPVNIQSFTTNFTFQLVDPAADGFTFAIQNIGTSALGGGGGSLGYAGIGKSVAIKFDLYNNAGEGPNSTGLYTDGTQPTVPAVNLNGTGINLHSGDSMAAQLAYDGTALTLTITDLKTNASFSYEWTINIPSTVGGNTAYVGFTGGTGGETSVQNIVSWKYLSGAATVPDYAAGFDAVGLKLNGSGDSIAESALQLTNGDTFDAASAYFTTRIDIGSFTSDFDFRLTAAVEGGFTFVLQNGNLEALGSSGSGFGYGGIPRSVAIKFFAHNIAGGWTDSAGVYVDGGSTALKSVNLTPTKVVLGTGDLIHAHVVYNGTTLTWTLTDKSSASKPTTTNSVAIAIPAVIGAKTAYLGFTGGSGTETSVEKIVNWTVTL